ncbi:hypothetical protein JD844_020804 [Phrynosoma platyrhinos]|uniref:Serpin domain-containing protein n=1 Tax=Phrynosoma platyrhinos TaxID=52577 RepID=A0ABQ7SSJ9_PHRPL|nr:hypothetical protein JD844_020804 [Phrynosoma platyrhinos]
MFNFYVGLFLAGLFCFAHSHHVPTHHHHDHHPPSEDRNNQSYLKIALRNAYFAFKVFHQLVSENSGKNVFFSPLSISAAFAMVSMGAKSNTLSQLLSALGFNQTEIKEQKIHEGFHHLLHLLNLPQSETELRIWNALFIHEEMEVCKKFLDDAKHYYQADVFPINCKNLKEAEVQINSYMENKTQMKDVIQAYWNEPFNIENTQEDYFFVDEQTTVVVPMMQKERVFLTYYDKDLFCHVVQIPYKGKASALFILPDPGKLRLVEDALGKDVLFKWLNSMERKYLHWKILGCVEYLNTNVINFGKGVDWVPDFRVYKDLHISMKSIINLSLLLTSLQVCCHHLPGHGDYQDYHEDSNPHEHKHTLSEDQQGQKSPDYHKIAPSNADFAFRFYRNIASDADGKNIFFSPLSISTAFSLLALGAKSETHDEIFKGLAFDLLKIEEKEIHEGFHQLIHVLNHPNNKAQVNLGNGLFIEPSLKFLPAFLEDAKNLYEADGFSTNFSIPRVAKKQINDYVQNKTHGKIAHALEELDPSTVMVLVNYIFFKAYWQNPFDTHFIRERDFFVDANTTVKVNMMHRKGYYKFLHDADLLSWVVELPYKGDATAFFILPDEGKLEHVEGALVKESLSKWTKSFRHE